MLKAAINKTFSFALNTLNCKQTKKQKIIVLNFIIFSKSKS